MKTAAGFLHALNDHLEFTPDPEPHALGRLHTDAAVRYLLGIPRHLPAPELGAGTPGLRLEGRDGMWIEILRRAPGRSFVLSMKDGEVDRPTDEMQAVSRLRLFIEHWGEETDLTSEIRLSPEQRSAIRDAEQARDAARRKRMAAGPGRVVFRKRVYLGPCLLVFAATVLMATALLLTLGTEGVSGAAAAALLALGSIAGLCLLFKTYRVEVDHDAGLIRVVALDGATLVGEVQDFKHADVKKLENNRSRHDVFVMTHDGRRHGVGSRHWSAGDAGRIADAINDALDLKEVDRKFLTYRRQGGRGQA